LALEWDTTSDRKFAGGFHRLSASKYQKHAGFSIKTFSLIIEEGGVCPYL